eukprot:TRINITY_DN112244_c0_g1_i1.p1 TRINITY_DN112244_c0_g1~~TRINITY_DN112244_c0_g1_i1.p1  ORF type:complete len:203 (-),score=30.31 TRINITY_DN112244_c0_g1_i1:71-616(-)
MVGSIGKTSTMGIARARGGMNGIPEDSGAGGGARNMVLTEVLMGRRPSSNLSSQSAWKGGRGRPGSARGGPSGSSSSMAVPMNMKLPPWIVIDAHLTYSSKTLNRQVEAIVEMVDNNRCEVELSFVETPGVRKLVPFAVIAGEDNPILGPWKPPLLTKAAATEGPAPRPAEERERSRSPKP